MSDLLSSKLVWLRLLGIFEGVTLVLLVFVAVPFKYLKNNPEWVEYIGPVHGVLFLLFVAFALYLGFEKSWNFWKVTMKIILSSFIPFGTFYIDHKLLRKMSKYPESFSENK